MYSLKALKYRQQQPFDSVPLNKAIDFDTSRLATFAVAAELKGQDWDCGKWRKMLFQLLIAAFLRPQYSTLGHHLINKKV